MYVKLNAILLAVLWCQLWMVKSDCNFTVINHNNEKYQPVLLYNVSSGYELAIPHHGYIELKPGQNISLLCSGERNYVRQTNANISTVTCINGNRVKLFRKVYNFEDIQCRHIVRGDVKATDKQCDNNGGKIYLIGYPPTRNDWVTLITVCYNKDIGKTIYTKHQIAGKEIEYRSRHRYRPNFSTKGLDKNISAFFKKPLNNESVFDVNNRLPHKLLKDSPYLARGHLSPDADFVLATAQYSTYYYINIALQWQFINGANWKSVENTIRNLAMHYGNLDVITGSHDILTSDNDIPSKYYLMENQLPIPKYIWKIAYHQKTKKAIVFVSLNFIDFTGNKTDIFCKDICEESGYVKTNWKNVNKGYIFCCSVPDFRKEVKNLPAFEVSEVLTAPEK